MCLTTSCYVPARAANCAAGAPGQAPSPVLVSVGRTPSSGASVVVALRSLVLFSELLSLFYQYILSLCVKFPAVLQAIQYSFWFVSTFVSSDNAVTYSLPFGISREYVPRFKFTSRLILSIQTYTYSFQ